MQNLTTDKFGFTIHEEMDLWLWLTTDTENVFSQYIHVIFDEENNSLRLYRSHSDDEIEGRLLTVIENVRFGTVLNREIDFQWLYLAGGEADSLMTFLIAYYHEDGEHLKLTYYDDNGKPLTERHQLAEESLYLEYRVPAPANIPRQTVINSVYETNGQMMGRFEGMKHLDRPPWNWQRI